MARKAVCITLDYYSERMSFEDKFGIIKYPKHYFKHGINTVICTPTVLTITVIYALFRSFDAFRSIVGTCIFDCEI